MGEEAETLPLPLPQPQPDDESIAAADGGDPLTIPHAPLTKIPFRPRKVRKLCPDPNSSPNPNPNPSTTSPPSKLNAEPNASSASGKSSASRARPSAGIGKSVAVCIQRPPSRALSTPGEIEIALQHLRSADPLLIPLMECHPPPSFDAYQNHTPFLALTKSILYQQLAYKAGTSIYSRFVSLCGGEALVVPETVLALDPESQLRHIGISSRKASYLQDLARKFQSGILSDDAIVNMDDKSLFAMLTMVNGIGAWSVHMFMIFSLHRPDVMPINDLGVRKGVQMLYGLEELPRPSHMEALCDKWRPYRSVGAWYMWRLVESKGSASSAAAVANATIGDAVGGVEVGNEVGVGMEGEVGNLEQQQPQMIDPINSILNLGFDGYRGFTS
ncbi:hypothetical protein MLD38_002098 [Melastoma candidum]|uniref:Uncharacterized protein n=1 Tax=Melastoma candidum TaxID=119954 RepID=A0ACB9SNZ1_9MYRT|nr:hypothetical protein MLD38_002098 [Melastoma candidum]